MCIFLSEGCPSLEGVSFKPSFESSVQILRPISISGMPVGFKDFYLTKKEQLLEGVKARMVAIGGRTLSPLLPPGHSIGKSGTRSSIGMVVLGSNQIMASAASLYPREEKK